ncbi:MAG TPA: glycogen debranching protein, partial [Rikenellaceae bacterium]|nr:glycogen debranching protein [Rikenellaceae bacterium]
SDRIVWVIAAWEIYKVTGDEAWLRQIYPIIKNTLDDDYKTLYNPQTGLYRGESSFLDWREQTYPKWMSNADIYTSENLGTNALHYQANKIIELISRILEEEGEVYLERSAAIKSDINKHFWIAERGFYGQYLYGREYLNISPRFEALGESLSVLFDIADINKAVSIFEKSPVTSFGTTCIYPQIPGIPPYHNNAIWPFVQSYWNLAAAKTGNERALVHGLASIYRAGAFFLTNYENFVAQTGDYNGTEINSDRMLWSMAGNIAMVHRVFIGMNFDVDGIRFNPVIPRVFSGTRTLRNFKYRKAILNITVKGYGRKIRSITLDGKPLLQNFLPSAINGEHDIEIKMDNKRFGDSNFELVKNHFSLTAPEIKIENNKISWNKVPGVSYYLLYINGDLPLKTQELNAIIDSGVSGEYKVSAVDSLGWESFTSEPLMFVPVKNLITIDIKENGKPYSEISTSVNKNLHLKAVTDTDGKYLFRLRYANGSGPWNTDNKCAIRTLLFNGAVTGTLVFPQRGVDLWNDWGWSNSYTLDLRKGINTIDIVFEEWNNNMNLIENKALLEYAELVRL